jgi:uncharacterized protein (TIGR02001 family)
MKNRKKFMLALMGAATLSMLSVGAEAEEKEKPTASADLGIYSKYIWRGVDYSDDSVVIQPSMTVGYKGFSLNLWGNLDTDVDGDDQDEPNWTETDWTLAYERKFGPVTAGLGFIYYSLDAVDDSRELYLSLSYDTILAPTLKIYREVAHLPSWYVNLGLSHSIELAKGVTLDFSGSVGYYYSDDDAFTEVNSTDKYRTLHDGVISAGFTFTLAEYITMSPVISYSFGLTDEAKDYINAATAFNDDSSFIYGGVNFSISF